MALAIETFEDRYVDDRYDRVREREEAYDPYGEKAFARHVTRTAKPVRRKSRTAFFGTLVLGATMLGGVWVGAAILSVGKMTTPGGLAPQHTFQTVLSMRPVPVANPSDAEAERLVAISKFSRIPTTADAKNGRLAGAQAAALHALRPAADTVRSGLDLALAESARKAADAEREQQFAALMAARPDEEAIRNALVPAMQSVVAVAPRGDMPDVLQDLAPATEVAQLNTIAPVEVEPAEVAAAQEAEPAKPTEIALADALPKTGPMPFGRPGAAAKPAESESAPSSRTGLDAIARVSPQKPGRDEKPDTVLAYAKPDNPIRQTTPTAPSRSAPSWPGIGTKVAIYDITNATVYMPDGSKLEAHSGIGKLRDDPDMTHIKMKGPTPAGTYKLSMREKLFHGVAAMRLTSVDGKNPLNRTGLLAHSYLLRTRGDSHGCVAFAQYDKFLSAFRRGDITHLVIVDEWDGKRPGRGPSSSGKTLVDLFSRGNDA